MNTSAFRRTCAALTSSVALFSAQPSEAADTHHPPPTYTESMPPPASAEGNAAPLTAPMPLPESADNNTQIVPDVFSPVNARDLISDKVIVGEIMEACQIDKTTAVEGIKGTKSPYTGSVIFHLNQNVLDIFAITTIPQGKGTVLLLDAEAALADAEKQGTEALTKIGKKECASLMAQSTYSYVTSVLLKKVENITESYLKSEPRTKDNDGEKRDSGKNGFIIDVDPPLAPIFIRVHNARAHAPAVYKI